MKVSLGLNVIATIFAFVVMVLTFTVWCLFTRFDDNKYRYSHFVMTFSILLIGLIQVTLGILSTIFASYAIKNYQHQAIQELKMNPEVPEQQDLTSLHHEED